MGGAGVAYLALNSTAPTESLGSSFENDYELGSELGRGAYGVVYKATCKRTGSMFAAKVVTRRKESEDAVRREIAMLERVGMHKGVAKLVAHYETDDSFYLVMEFVAGGGERP